jgi:uncharacterized protein YprB with RNaseH-like and TPR domain
MLEHTFCHIPGIGPTTEQALWQQGIRTWEDARQLADPGGAVRPRTRALLQHALPDSRRALQDGNAAYFARLGSLGEAWRAYSHFRDVVYLDIETTGLSPTYDKITLVGVSDGQTYTVFVAGQNLAELPVYLSRFRVITTFNGAGFDLRFLRAAFPDLTLPPLHIDLRGVTRKLGLTGGLKAIEQTLGLPRDPAVAHLSGFDAVMLWARYRRGDRKALDLLIQYNTEDVVHLTTILETSYTALTRRATALFADPGAAPHGSDVSVP